MNHQYNLNHRLNVLLESSINDALDPYSGTYDRGYAEDLLFNTLAPLTNHSKWNSRWDSNFPQPDEYSPNGPAPTWTPEQVVFAMAGDPNKLFSGGPTSPRYGKMGGAPLYRLAKRIAKKFGRPNDDNLIADLYANGFIPLVRKMHPGFDAGRVSMIGWLMQDIQGAMENGIGGTKRGEGAIADSRSSSDILGLRAAAKITDPNVIRNSLSKIGEKFRTTAVHDNDPGNPFGTATPEYYQRMSAYADALESGDEIAIERTRDDINSLVDVIADKMTPIRGAGTGLGQAISSLDRKTAVGVVSADASAAGPGGEETGGIKDTLEAPSDEDNGIDRETVATVLRIALENDIGSIVGKNSKYHQLAVELGNRTGIGGSFTANEYRYIIRSIGPQASEYPGKGVLRSALEKPRDSNGWWKAGEDPEIDQIPGKSGAIWTSKWKREGYQPMQPQGIADELNAEIAELNHYGIATARTLKSKSSGREEAVGRVAVATTVKKAMIKMRVIADIHRDQLGLDENISNVDDRIERRVISECATFIANRLHRILLSL